MEQAKGKLVTLLDLLHASIIALGTAPPPSETQLLFSLKQEQALQVHMVSNWKLAVLAKPLVSLVLLLWSLIVLSGASFVLSDWTCWCSVLAKPLVSLVLLLWSLIVVFLRGAHGDKDSRNWPTLPWTGCLPKVFFGTSPGAPFGPFWCLCWCSGCVLSLCFFLGRFLLCLLHQ